MKKARKRYLRILFVFVTLLVGNSVFAQPPGGGRQGPPPIPNTKQINKMVAELSEKLSLNDKQETKIAQMYHAHFADVKKATSSGRPDRNKMEALKSCFEKEVKSVLTKEQQKLFTTYQKKHDPGQNRKR